MKRITAFTLIELLVVVAIIAVLAALLFPVFAMAKRSAKRTTALSNLDEIGKASYLYLADNDDTLPFLFPIQPTWPGYNVVLYLSGPGFTTTYDPYLRNKEVWFSPEDRLPNKGTTSFVANEQLCFAWPMSSIPRPADAIYMTDRTDIPQSVPPFTSYVWWQFCNISPFDPSKLPGTLDPVAVASQIDPIRYVGNVGLYLFLDCHAKALPFDATWGDASHNLHLVTKQ